MEQIKPKYNREEAENLVYDDGWKVIPFWKPYGKGMGPHVFCQWYNCKFTDNEHTYTCTEQYMMFKKAELFGDLITGEKFLQKQIQIRCENLDVKLRILMIQYGIRTSILLFMLETILSFRRMNS